MSVDKLREAIDAHQAKFIDLRFTDTIGKEQHITIPVAAADERFIRHGKLFDGSSIKGWKTINDSDLALRPDLNTLLLDPFFQDATLLIRCDVVDPDTGESYARDPRAIAARAEHYLQSTGLADEALFGPEPEFFLFDSVRWETSLQGAFYAIDAEEGAWNSGKKIVGGNIGHRPGIKGGYFPVPPVDSSQDIRSAMTETLQALGIMVEAHHHEVATANQCEIATRYNTLQKKADELQLFKYVVQQVAHNYGKSATFMPKPLVGDNGNGMHCHQSLRKDGINLFTGDHYAGLSEMALYYIGGLIKHARALNALTNPSVNSYKRLVPGFEAPVWLAYSARNRSAAVRIPASEAQARRIEVRFPDATANPYLAFSAMLLAGLDGIQHKIHPGEPLNKDIYELRPDELEDRGCVANNLSQALDALRQDHDFLLRGNVFTPDFIDSYLALREQDIAYLRHLVHPGEFELYYSV